MTEIETIARKWGDPIAVIDLSNLFGKLHTKKTPQQLKNEGREGRE